MKHTTKAALLGALALSPIAAQAQTIPAAIVAVVDRDRISQECNACKVAAGQIQGLITQLQQRQQALGAPLQTEGQSLQTEAQRVSALPDGPAKVSAAQALQPRIGAFQQRQGQAQQELERMQQNIQSVNANVVRQINDKLGPVISQVMQQRGANIAIDENATLATARTVDITDPVLASLNTQLTSLSVTPLPQQAAPAGTAAPATGRRQPTGR